MRGLLKVDLSPYPSLVNEELTQLIQVTLLALLLLFCSLLCYCITLVIFIYQIDNGFLQITNQSTFLDVSNCKYISYETASQLAATYPNLIMKVDNSLFNNKHRLKRDTAFVKSLYKLVWNDDAITARILSQFQNLRKLDMSVCELNLMPLANHPVGLGYIRFLKFTNVLFTKPNSLHPLLKSSNLLEVLLPLCHIYYRSFLSFFFSFLFPR